MHNYTLAHCIFLSLLPFSLVLFSFSLSCTALLQTVLGVEMRSSRVSLSWRWRSSGTSAASDVRPATWSSQESTSASECLKRRRTFKKQLILTCHQGMTCWIFSSLDGLNRAFDTLQHFCFYSLCCRDGVPYCEADYHAQYGVKCETCSRYISGRVLEVRKGPDFNIRLCSFRFSCAVFWSIQKSKFTVVAECNECYQN